MTSMLNGLLAAPRAETRHIRLIVKDSPRNARSVPIEPGRAGVTTAFRAGSPGRDLRHFVVQERESLYSKRFRLLLTRIAQSEIDFVASVSRHDEHERAR